MLEKSRLRPWLSDTKSMFSSVHSANSLPKAACIYPVFPIPSATITLQTPIHLFIYLLIQPKFIEFQELRRILRIQW